MFLFVFYSTGCTASWRSCLPLQFSVRMVSSSMFRWRSFGLRLKVVSFQVYGHRSMESTYCVSVLLSWHVSITWVQCILSMHDFVVIAFISLFFMTAYQYLVICYIAVCYFTASFCVCYFIILTSKYLWLHCHCFRSMFDVVL